MNNWFWAFVVLFAWHIMDSIERGWTAAKNEMRERLRDEKKVRVVVLVDDLDHRRFLGASANVDKDMCEIIVTPIRECEK